MKSVIATLFCVVVTAAALSGIDRAAKDNQ
jgi:hypothetical protein